MAKQVGVFAVEALEYGAGGLAIGGVADISREMALGLGIILHGLRGLVLGYVVRDCLIADTEENTDRSLTQVCFGGTRAAPAGQRIRHRPVRKLGLTAGGLPDDLQQIRESFLCIRIIGRVEAGEAVVG